MQELGRGRLQQRDEVEKGRRLSSLTEEGSVTVLHVRTSLNNGFCDVPQSVRGGADLISSALVRTA